VNCLTFTDHLLIYSITVETDRERKGVTKMNSSKPVKNTSAETDGVLKTKFVTPDQSAILTQVVELSLDQLDSVGGGLLAEDGCKCCHKPPSVA
jgi:hypothetical protein